MNNNKRARSPEEESQESTMGKQYSQDKLRSTRINKHKRARHLPVDNRFSTMTSTVKGAFSYNSALTSQIASDEMQLDSPLSDEQATAWLDANISIPASYAAGPLLREPATTREVSNLGTYSEAIVDKAERQLPLDVATNALVPAKRVEAKEKGKFSENKMRGHAGYNVEDITDNKSGGHSSSYEKDVNNIEMQGYLCDDKKELIDNKTGG